MAYKQDRKACCAYISACAGIVTLLAALLQPFMPSFSAKLQRQLALEALPALDDGLVTAAASIATLLPAEHRISETEPSPLFRKIGDEEVETLRKRFAGNQADRADRAAAEAAASSSGTGGGASSGKGAVSVANGSATPAAVAGADGKSVKKQQQQQATKGEAQQKKGGDSGSSAGKGGGGGKAAAEQPVDISRIDLRVGLIRKAWRHPDAER